MCHSHGTVVVAATLLLSCIASAQPVNLDWVGGNSGDVFSDANNWNPNTVVQNDIGSANLIFGGNATTFTPMVDSNVTNIGDITFNGGAAGFTLAPTNGFDLTFNANTFITNQTANEQVFTAAINTGADLTVDAATGDLTFNNPFNATGVLRATGVNNTTISGAITGAGQISTGNGTLTLNNGANTYSGGTDLFSGTLNIGHDNALGTGRLGIIASQGMRTLQATGGPRTIANDYLFFSSAPRWAAAIDGDQDLTLTGPGSFRNTLTLTVNNTGITEFAGDITSLGFSRLIKNGPGTLRLSGSSMTIPGGVTVDDGVLDMQGNFANNVTVNDGGIVMGDGMIGGNLNANTGNHVRPGNSVGTLNANQFSLRSGATLEVEIDKGGAQEADRLDVTGANLEAGSIFDVSVIGQRLAVGDAFTIITTASDLTDSGATVNAPPQYTIVGRVSGSGDDYELFVQNVALLSFTDLLRNSVNPRVGVALDTLEAADANNPIILALQQPGEPVRPSGQRRRPHVRHPGPHLRRNGAGV